VSGMHFYSMGLLRMAYETAQRADSCVAKASDHRTDDTLIAIILATSAAEAFVNDMAGYIKFLADYDQLNQVNGQRLVAIGEAIEAFEEGNAQIRPKYLAAALLLGCNVIRRGKEPFQSFSDLVILRNAIIHARPVSPDEKVGPAKVVASLAQRGIAGPSVSDATWWMQVRTSNAAWWACESANNIMIELVDSIAAIADYQGTIAGFGALLRGSIAIGKNRPFHPEVRGK
jgi:hypothetical protein